MIHSELVVTVGAAHAAILVAAITAWQKLGGRSDPAHRLMDSAEPVLRALRSKVADELADYLKANLSGVAIVPNLILEGTASYTEKQPELLAGEKYRESIRDFVEEHSRVLVDVRSLVLWRQSWGRASRALSWGIIACAVWSAIVAAALWFVDRPDLFTFPDLLVKIASTPTAFVIAWCLVCLVIIQRNHDRVSSICEQYAETAT